MSWSFLASPGVGTPTVASLNNKVVSYRVACLVDWFLFLNRRRATVTCNFTERVLLGDVFHAKNDTKTLCFTVISCKILSKIEVLSNFVRSKPIPIWREYQKNNKPKNKQNKKNNV